MTASRLRGERVAGDMLLARYNGSANFFHISNARLKLNSVAEVRSSTLKVACLGFFFEAVPNRGDQEPEYLQQNK